MQYGLRKTWDKEEEMLPPGGKGNGHQDDSEGRERKFLAGCDSHRCVHRIAGEQRICFAWISSSFFALGRECAQARGEQTGSTFAPCNHIATRDFAQARNHDASEYFAAQHKLAERKSSHDDASKHLWAQRQPAGNAKRWFIAFGEPPIGEFGVREPFLGEFTVSESPVGE